MIVPLIIAAIETRPGWGRILLSCCPGRTDLDHDLAIDLEILGMQHVSAVVTLCDDDELDELEVSGLGIAVRNAGMAWFHLPFDNYCVPEPHWEDEWLDQGPKVRALLRAGENVHIHCRAGCGRSGLLAARLLVELDLCGPEEAISRVRLARPCAIEREEQEDVVYATRPITDR